MTGTEITPTPDRPVNPLGYLAKMAYWCHDGVYTFDALCLLDHPVEQARSIADTAAATFGVEIVSFWLILSPGDLIRAAYKSSVLIT